MYFILTSLLHFTFHPCFSFFPSYWIYNFWLFCVSLYITLTSDDRTSPTDNPTTPQTPRHTRLNASFSLPCPPLSSHLDGVLLCLLSQTTAILPLTPLHKPETHVSCYFGALLSFSLVYHSLFSNPSTGVQALPITTYTHFALPKLPGCTLPLHELLPPISPPHLPHTWNSAPGMLSYAAQASTLQGLADIPQHAPWNAHRALLGLPYHLKLFSTLHRTRLNGNQ